ncbi:MAG: hypothetical protein KC621_31000 [Myxococcales bacterium]|nr:hypothetical protein [Myxococcales bacterium]
MSELVEAMAREADELVNEGSEGFPVTPDPRRSNRTILIDGVRGAGKTSALVHLLRTWADGVRSGNRASPHLMVPLETIDLRGTAPNTDLALVVAAAFKPLEDHLGSGSDENRSNTMLWRDLVRALVAWRLDPREARSGVDPDQYAWELGRGASQGLGVECQWRKYVDALVEGSRKAFGRRPLLIVPIDDGDMEHERVGELCDVLRALHHPRVVFLVTAELDVLRRSLEHLEASYLADDRGLAEHLARRILERVFPPSHRFVIEPLPIKERLAYRLEPDASPLHELLEAKLGLSLSPRLYGEALPGWPRALTDLALLAQETEAARILEFLLAHVGERPEVDFDAEWVDLGAYSSVLRPAVNLSNILTEAPSRYRIEPSAGWALLPVAHRQVRFVRDHPSDPRKEIPLDTHASAVLALLQDWAIRLRIPVTRPREPNDTGWLWTWVGLNAADGEVVSWPVPHDEARAVYERFGEKWSKTKLSLSGDNMDGDGKLYLRTWLEGSVPARADWSELLRRVVSRYPNRRRQWLLLAAPEYGLSEAAAVEILACAKSLGVSPGVFPQLSWERRANFRGVEQRGVTRLLATLRERLPNHPWYQEGQPGEQPALDE